jgi:hypothetical protein
LFAKLYSNLESFFIYLSFKQIPVICLKKTIL